MKRNSMIIGLSYCFGSCIVRTVARTKTSGHALKEIGDLLVGRWTAESTFAADFPGWEKRVISSRLLSPAVGCRSGCNSMRRSPKQGHLGGILLVECGIKAGQVCRHGFEWQVPRRAPSRSSRRAKIAWEMAGSFVNGQRFEGKGEQHSRITGNTRIEAGTVTVNGVRNEYRDTYKRVAK